MNFSFGNNAIIIKDLQIELSIFTQYEPNNTLSKYNNIFYNVECLPNSIQINGNQQGISLELQNEIDNYIKNYDIYKKKEYDRLNPVLTLEQKKQQVINILSNIYSARSTWLVILKSGDFVKDDWDLNTLRDEISAFISSKIANPMPLSFRNTKNEVKVVSIDPVKMPAISLERIVIAQQIGAKNIFLFNEINAVKTQKALEKYTQEYLQGEFDKINKTIIID